MPNSSGGGSHGGDEGFVDWKFEGMQGDYTDDVITSRVGDKFTDMLLTDIKMRSNVLREQRNMRACIVAAFMCLEHASYVHIAELR